MTMKASIWRNWTIGAGLVLVFFSAPHLIDDFLYHVPAEFGISVWFTQVLAGIFHLQLVGLFILVARDRRGGYWGLLFWGITLTLAGLLKHIPKIVKPEPYWSGWFSEMLILGLMTAGVVTALAASMALHNLKQR